MVLRRLVAVLRGKEETRELIDNSQDAKVLAAGKTGLDVSIGYGS